MTLATTNPYADVATATSFWTEYPTTTPGLSAWTALGDSDKLAYLVRATKELDSFRWQGFKLYSGQSNQHPRKYRVDPFSYSPWGILMVYLDPWGYWYEQQGLSTPYYPSGYWTLGNTYVLNATVFDQATANTYQCKLAHTAAANNEPGVGAYWATYWTLTSGFPTRVIQACCLEAKAMYEADISSEALERKALQKAGAISVRYGDVAENYIPGSRWNDEGMYSADAYQLIEIYLEKATMIV